MVDDAFRTLADPTRRRMLDLLAERGEMTVGELAAEFPDLVSSGISKHLMAMRASGLVVAQKVGRNQVYRVHSEGFRQALVPWLSKYDKYLAGSLESLRDLAESPEEPPE